MRNACLPTTMIVVALATLCAFSALANAQATVLYAFNQSAAQNGWAPYGGVIFGKDGNLYGTTSIGGNLNDCNGSGCGVVYELSGGTETVLYAFAGYPTDGSNPYDDLVMDTKGNLYGVTARGGANGGPTGFGTVFKLASDGTETILHSFAGTDGCYPVGGLLLEGGILYGTTFDYGCGYGSIFSINLKTGVFSTLYTFASGTDNGSSPQGNLAYKDGNLYGTTEFSGANGFGIVYQFTLSTSTFNILYSFKGGADGDGEFPIGGPIFGKGGNLYGTTLAGGGNTNCDSGGCGTVYEVTLKGVETVLHAFDGYIAPNGGDGSNLQGSLVADKKGNLFGFASNGGANNHGTVYELSPGKKGSWTFDLLYSFNPDAFQGDEDGSEPLYGSLVLDANDNVYGTTVGGGGSGGGGTVYEVTP